MQSVIPINVFGDRMAPFLLRNIHARTHTTKYNKLSHVYMKIINIYVDVEYKFQLYLKRVTNLF